MKWPPACLLTRTLETLIETQMPGLTPGVLTGVPLKRGDSSSETTETPLLSDPSHRQAEGWRWGSAGPSRSVLRARAASWERAPFACSVLKAEVTGSPKGMSDKGHKESQIGSPNWARRSIECKEMGAEQVG